MEVIVMCNRECICKNCKNGPCGICKYNEEVINQCRIGGVEECEHFKEKDGVDASVKD